MMGRKIKEKTLYLGLKFVDNLDLPKDYRLERDILPPNIQQAQERQAVNIKKVHDIIKSDHDG